MTGLICGHSTPQKPEPTDVQLWCPQCRQYVMLSRWGWLAATLGVLSGAGLILWRWPG